MATAKIALRRDQLAKFRRIKGIATDTEFAARLGMHKAQVSRILSGKCAPGTAFIGSVLELFGIECFADLFSVIPDDNHNAA